MEMRVSAVETAGPAGRGGVPRVSSTAGWLGRRLHQARAPEMYDFPGQQDSVSDPRGSGDRPERIWAS